MSIEIRAIDPHDEAALHAWWEVGRAATAERPGKPWPAWEVSRGALGADNPEYDTTLVGAFDGPDMVGSVLFLAPLKENPHTCSVNVHVVPSRRRQGIGSALVADAEERAAGLGRSTMQSEGFVPPSETGPAELFARDRGFAVASRESFKELTLADYLERRPGLVDAIGSAAEEYRILTFDTVCPEEHVASFGRLLGTVFAEIPLGELDLEDSAWSPERLRAAEQRLVGIGRHLLTALAIAPDGSVAGSSDVRINEAEPTHGQVGVTIVDPAHRGHRLGLALKCATHDLAIASYPPCASVDTCNAEVNEHMNAVNEAFGYRSIETLLELQKKLA